MIPRYTPSDIGALWTEQAKIEAWLEVEVAACRAMSELDLIPREDFEAIERAAKTCDFEQLAQRAAEIEATTKHDIIAFLTAFEEVAGPVARHVHFGLTSSDILDTALALRLVRALDMIDKDISALRAVIRQRAHEHRRTLMVGRSHGIHAEPTSFGMILAGFDAELSRAVRRLSEARKDIAVGKLSGAVGTYAHLPLEVEEKALAYLGLDIETVATQVVQRDRHAHFFNALSVLAGSLERMAVEVRHLQRTEVREAEEPFSVGQKGSSAMPHKRNPILTENITGLARLIRGWAQAASENIALWHERDISHSSVERVIGPDATITTVFMLRRMRRVFDGLVVYPQRMLENLNATRGLVFSQGLLLALTRKGLERQAAYVIVQRNAMRVWDEGVELLPVLLEDKELREHMSESEIRDVFDIERLLQNIDKVIHRATSQPLTAETV